MSRASEQLQAQLTTYAILGVGGYLLLKALPTILPSLTNSVATTAGEAAGAVANAAVTAPVTAVSAAVGLPTPAQTTTDPAVARWIIDYPGTGGTFAASKWASAGALWTAETSMSAGDGVPPPVGTDLYAMFPPPIDWGTAGQTGVW